LKNKITPEKVLNSVEAVRRWMLSYFQQYHEADSM